MRTINAPTVVAMTSAWTVGFEICKNLRSNLWLFCFTRSGSAGLRSGSLPNQVHWWNSSSDLSRVQLGLRSWLGSHHFHVGWRDPLLPADGHLRGCNVLSTLSGPAAGKNTHRQTHIYSHKGDVLLFFTRHMSNVFVNPDPVSLVLLLSCSFCYF